VLLRLAGTCVILASVSRGLALLPLFGFAPFAAEAYGSRVRRRCEERAAEPRRLLNELFKISTTASSGKELRVFGLSNTLDARYDDAARAVEREDRRAVVAAIGAGAAGWLVFAAAFATTVAVAANNAVHGDGTLGDVLMTFTLAQQVGAHMTEGANLLAQFLTALRAAKRYIWLEDYAHNQTTTTAARTPPQRLQHGITLNHLSFVYPGTNTIVLDDLDADLPAGAIVAIVGDNGAGKTTLVKVLAGMYAPTSGAILVDNIELSSLDLQAWRASSTAAFQDFVRYELAAQETVGVGDLPRMADEPAVRAALDRAHASDAVDTLEHGLATQLGRSFRNGRDLSAGQWQKLALGRTMMRDAPLLVLLDEPTASLDSETEYRLFRAYAEGGRRVAQMNGAITILISHRFSTVRMADLILVLDGGRLVAKGTHGELMETGGLYAELFNLQARTYR
jgi:ATP-binding cassette subfamily B protein